VRAVLEDDHGQAVARGARGLQQPLGLRVALDVEPAVGDEVAGQEVPDGVGLLGEAVADDAHAALGLPLAHVGLPVRQEVVDHGVEVLLGRVPRLGEVVVELDVVDRLDRGVRVRVGREEDALGLGRLVHRQLEEVDALHAGHALVGEQERDALPAQRELVEDVQRGLAGVGADDLELLAVAAAQVALDRAAHAGVVVHGEQDGAARLGGRGWRAGWRPPCSARHQAEARLVDVAPAPVLTGLDRGDDGWPSDRKWAVAWRLGESSQQETFPQERQTRRWTQRSPVFRHSSQPGTRRGWGRRR
jgi:hypothetical protein